MRLRYLEGFSIRGIAKRLQMSRKTVRRCLATSPPKPRKPAERTSLLTPFRPRIEQLLTETPELKATQVFERIRDEGYVGGISILRDLVRKVRPSPTVTPHLVVRHRPGETLQIDWADFGFALPGVPRRVSAFVAMLPFSRMMYLEFTLSQSLGSLLRCMDRAVDFFGGVTTADVFDNMKTVVLEHLPGRAPLFNPRFLEYANHRGGFAVIACTVRHPEGKGSVERGIRFVRERFWTGRSFSDLDDLNRQAREWLVAWGNARQSDRDDKIPHLVFEHIEREALKPVPELPFDTDDLNHETVNTSCRVRFDRNTYSVPWHFVSQHVSIRGAEHTVRVFLGPRCIAEHKRCWSIRQDIENEAHREQLLESRKRTPEQIAGSRFGKVGEAYFKALAATRRSLRREGIRLVTLAELFGTQETQRAIANVMQRGHVGADYVEYVLRHERKLRPQKRLLLGNDELDSVELSPSDLSIYDAKTEES